NEAGELTKSFNVMVRSLDEQRSGLMEALALLDSMLNNAPIGFGFFDESLQCVRSNDVMAGMYGTQRGWIEKQVEVVFQNGFAIRDLELTTHGDGMRSWLLHFYPVHADGRVWRVGVITMEITERLQAEEMLRKTEKLAATGRLAASIAHEINNPLEAVMNLLYLLQTHSGMDEQARSFVETAQGELQRVSEITQQTLRFYRQSSAAGESSVVEMLDSVVKLYQSRIGSLQIDVRKEYRGDPKVYGFNGELRQVFANFIGNALDAMGNGGVLVLRVRQGSGRGPNGLWGKGVFVTIADTGSGMSKQTLARAFEAFFTTKQATGTGLGLWLSEEIVRKHQGRVSVKSRTGQACGTVFSVFFPEGAKISGGEKTATV
ncbi:MAG: ATP-binding protein, partial [Bryocella sp.]